MIGARRGDRRAHSAGQVLAAALFGIFATNINVSVLAVVVPRLVAELETTKSVVTWVVVAPMLAYAVLGPIAGKLGDLYGRRRIYLVGLGGTALFGALTAGSTSIGMLIAFRTIAATLGSSCAPAGMAIISQQFPRDRRVKALGYWGLVLAGGPVLGMIVGGPVADAFGWRWLFIPQVPLALVAMAIAARVLPESEARARVRFDVTGSALLGAAIASLLVGVNRAPVLGWSHPVIAACFAAAPAFGVLFVLHERTCPHALIPLEYFKRRGFAVPMVAQFFVNFSYQGGFVLVPLMLSEVFGDTSTRISLTTLPRPLFYALAGPLAGFLGVRYGERRLAVGGALLVCASSVLLSMIEHGDATVVVVLALAIAGAGLGSIVPAVTATVTTAVDDADLGVVGAAAQTTYQIGTVLGMQALQTVQVAFEPRSGVVSSYETAFRAGAVVALVGLVVAWFMDRRDRGRAPAPRRRLGRAAARPSGLASTSGAAEPA